MNEPYEHLIPPLKYLDRRQCTIPEQFMEYYRKTGQLVEPKPEEPPVVPQG
jgi:hypothetical protein